ncbi:MAG: PQQ-binding-like beta-propeller repeat protein [Rhodanobacteraceae bacterium]|nr:PQQ-binding-like beta-propeller repeat protein [Rhodanobacteraceae bacterium]
MLKMRATCCIALLAVSLALACNASAANGDSAAPTTTQKATGAQLFESHCGGCHSGFLGSRAPSKQVLAKFPPRSIIQALTTGVMRTQGYSLSGEQRRAIAEHLTGVKYSSSLLNESRGRCDVNTGMSDPSKSPQWNGWGNGLANASFQSGKSAGLTPDQVKHLKLKWAFGFPDSFSAWSQPVIASQRIFVGSQAGVFYSLSVTSGCTYWQFEADAGVRSAASIVHFDAAARKRYGAEYGVLFGDTAGKVYALDAANGRLLWKVQVETHPLARITGSPTLYGDRYYVPMSSSTTVEAPTESCCTFRGSLSALDVGTGKILWKTYTIPQEPKPIAGTEAGGKTMYGPAGAAIWSPPLVDAKRGVVYAGTGNSYTGDAINSDALIAFDLKSGALRWARTLTPNDVWIPTCQAQAAANCDAKTGPNLDIASPPMLVSTSTARGSKELILVGQKSGVAYALDPDRKGAEVWQYRAGHGGTAGGIVWGSAFNGDTAYFPVSDLTEPEPGGVHAVDVRTGVRRWRAAPQPLLCGSPRYGCTAAQPVGVSVIPGVVFAGSIDGGFRAHASADGALLWQYDTNQDFKTVNEVPANGGSLIGAGASIAGGMVFVNSGYGTNGGRAGNVLLAFSAD